jgi:hypothetical protein
MKRGSRDRNHNDVAHAFELMGCSVADCALAGITGWPDLVVGVVGINHLVEVKNPDTAYGRAGLNSDQSAFARDWRGGPIYVVTHPGDVPDLVREWRARLRANA